MTPYWSDDLVTLHLGDCREVLPALGITADLVLADPPYGDTGHAWDRWPEGWLDVAATVGRSLWCFGSQRMFFAHLADFTGAGWKLSQDVLGVDEDGEPIVVDVGVVWEKNTGSSPAADRFRRVHEHILHWYREAWASVYHEVPRVAHSGPYKGTVRRTVDRAAQFSGGRLGNRDWVDDGTRATRSVIYAPNLRGKAIHPTEKPVDLLKPLISYACPPGGLVVDPFAGSGSTLEAARLTGRRAIGIEADEKYAEKAARRLSQQPLEMTP